MSGPHKTSNGRCRRDTTRVSRALMSPLLEPPANGKVGVNDKRQSTPAPHAWRSTLRQLFTKVAASSTRYPIRAPVGRKPGPALLTDRWFGPSGVPSTGSITVGSRRGCGSQMRCAAPRRSRGLAGSTIGERIRNDDLDLSQRRFGRLGSRLFARTARRGQVAPGARLRNEIPGRVPAAFLPSLYNARCLMVQRWLQVLPLKIVS